MTPNPRTSVRFPSLLALPLFASCACLFVGCEMPDFEARRELTRSEPAEGLRSLACESHNGAIEVRGSAEARTVEVRARLSARGYTQAEADANCAALDVEVVRRGADLLVRGKQPADQDWRVQSSFEFVVEVPLAFAADVSTHNGSVLVAAVTGDVRAKTHNGEVEAEVAGAKVAIETHNGRVVLKAAGDGPLEGIVATHNGSVEIDLGARSCTVDASTHNGSVTSRGGRVVEQDDHHVRMQAGAGGGKLEVTAHNGAVSVLSGAK